MNIEKQVLGAFAATLIASATLAAELPSLNDFPIEAAKAGQDVMESCKENNNVQGLEHAAQFIQLKDGKRLILFEPAKLCDVVFKRNGVCSTDGCDIFVLKEEMRGFWTTALQQTVLNHSSTTQVAGKPFQLHIDIRGDVKPCKKARQSTCTFELSWLQNGFRWKAVK